MAWRWADTASLSAKAAHKASTTILILTFANLGLCMVNAVLWFTR